VRSPLCASGQICLPSGTCFEPPQGEGCTNDSDCGIGEICIVNQCIDLGGGGGPLNCNDNNPCTSDRLESSCTVVCAPGTSCCSTFCTHTATNNGGSCDDSNVCTTGTVCSSGTCGGGQQVVCDNGQFCDGTETCNASAGRQAGTPPSTDDGIGCTDDSCDEENDVIINLSNDLNCDNGEFCDGVETCDDSLDCQADGNPPRERFAAKNRQGYALTLPVCLTA